MCDVRSGCVWVCAAGVLLATLACGREPIAAPSPGPAPAPATLDLDGTWLGKTSQAGGTTPTRNVDAGYFSYTVFNGGLTSIEFQFTFDAPCAGNLTSFSTLSGVAIGADGSFAMVSNRPPTTISVSGRFGGTSQASGMLTVTFGRFNGCESTNTATWTAVKQ